MPGKPGNWQRLGQQLEARRVELDPRYLNLTRFAKERGIDFRLCWDLEHARRTNYRRPTLIAVESAYGWARGSIDSVLAGGEPTPATGTQPMPVIAEPAPAPAPEPAPAPQEPLDSLTPRELEIAKAFVQVLRTAAGGTVDEKTSNGGT